VRSRKVDDSVLMQQNVALINNSDATDSHPAIARSPPVTRPSPVAGVIQLNQSAGVGNRMANTLSIRVAD
jgi:hypothetical protein